MKAYVLYFETKDVVRLVKAKLEDGMVIFENKAFDVDKFQPRVLKKGFSYYPLYMLKWGSIHPCEEFNPIFEEDKKINPEILRKTISLKILGNMLKLKKEFSPLLLIIMGAVLGFFLTYALIISKVIVI